MLDTLRSWSGTHRGLSQTDGNRYLSVMSRLPPTDISHYKRQAGFGVTVAMDIGSDGGARDDMSGGCFSISSLGGIGGTGFTPIINAPEVAIMGVCRSQMKPVWGDGQFVPRLMLPLSLSWDHRVIDGAAAGRFNAYFAASRCDGGRPEIQTSRVQGAQRGMGDFGERG